MPIPPWKLIAILEHEICWPPQILILAIPFGAACDTQNIEDEMMETTTMQILLEIVAS